MMSKLFLHLIWSLTICVSSSAQTQEIVILRDNPGDVKLFKVIIPIMNVRPSIFNNTSFDLLTGIHCTPVEKLYLHASFRYMVLEATNDNTGPFNSDIPFGASVYRDTKSTEWTIDGSITIKTRPSTKKIKIPLYTTYNVRYYSDVPAQTIKTKGVRLGVERGLTWFALAKAKVTGTEASTNRPVEFSNGLSSTYLNYTLARVGIFSAESYNLHVNAIGRGYRVNSGMKYFYMDALIPIQMQYDDIFYYVPANESPARVPGYKHIKINNGIDNLPIGLCVGLRLIPYVRMFSVNAEAGIMPFSGITGLYGKLGFNLLVGKGDSKMMPFGKSD
jgi:hypothetical protein